MEAKLIEVIGLLNKRKYGYQEKLKVFEVTNQALREFFRNKTIGYNSNRKLQKAFLIP